MDEATVYLRYGLMVTTLELALQVPATSRAASSWMSSNNCARHSFKSTEGTLQLPAAIVPALQLPATSRAASSGMSSNICARPSSNGKEGKACT
eukprot:scaffold208870_cov18-Tisochrysis_lutea.AAC.1